MTVRFDKYEGLGNDFIVVEGAEALPVERVIELCDRHFGVGADGVLLVGPARSPGADAAMIVQNADGSRPEMCGNGLRCVALHLARRDGAGRAEYLVDTDAGARACSVDRQGGAGLVRIDLGRAVVLGEASEVVAGVTHLFSRISMGNPHAVRLGGILPASVVDAISAEISRRTPGGTNVEFVAELGPAEFELAVWERGVGRTLACGTGAGAAGVALAVAGRAPFGAPLLLKLPGGPLEVTVEQESLRVTLKGPARRVFAGSIEP